MVKTLLYLHEMSTWEMDCVLFNVKPFISDSKIVYSENCYVDMQLS